MRRSEKQNRVLMTGIRKGGDADYEFKIFGNPASQFPPLIIKMSLLDLQQWLRQMQAAPAGSLRERNASRLRPAG